MAKILLKDRPNLISKKIKEIDICSAENVLCISSSDIDLCGERY